MAHLPPPTALPPSPAGAGKTSLLLRLSGKAGAYGEQTGVVRVNGRPDKLERWRQVMGFVPQVGELGGGGVQW